MADLPIAELLPEVCRRLAVALDNPEAAEALDAAAGDVLTYSGLEVLPDDPRVRRHLVPYACAIYLAASAPNGAYAAVGDDQFAPMPVANDLSAKFAPRFAFLSVSWGIA